jgi:hypothetical protein
MRSPAISVSAMVAVAILLLACDRASEPATGERAPAPVPSDPVIEVQMGKGVTANGTVPENARTDDFRPGDTIFITARLRGLDGQPVTVAWFGPGDLSAGTETAAVKPDGTIYFTKADTSSWIPGDYRVTLSAGPRTLISEQFHILGSEAAVMPHQ